MLEVVSLICNMPGYDLLIQIYIPLEYAKENGGGKEPHRCCSNKYD